MMRRRGTFTNTDKKRERHSYHITYYRTYTLTYSNSSSHRGGHTHSDIQVHKVEDTLTHALTRTLTHALTHTLIYTLTHTLTHMEKHGGMVKRSHSLTRSHADTPQITNRTCARGLYDSLNRNATILKCSEKCGAILHRFAAHC